MTRELRITLDEKYGEIFDKKVKGRKTWKKLLIEALERETKKE